MSWNASDKTFEKRRPVRVDVVERGRSRFPWVPGAYWQLMTEVGFGEFGGVMFYEGVVPLRDLGLLQGPPDFVAFADDGAGFFYGFHPSHSTTVVGVDSAGWGLESTGQDLEGFVGDLSAVGKA